MKKVQTGRTLIETLAIMALIGILSVSGLQLYAKAMNVIRANYIMEQVFIKASELAQNPVSHRKMVDISMQNSNKLSYGYSFCNDTEDCKPKREGAEIVIKVEGYFPVSLCKILKKKIRTQEYVGLKNIKADNVSLKPDDHNDCPTDSEISSMTFVMDAEFKLQTF